MKFPRILLCLGLLWSGAMHSADRPNILMIAIDDQNDWIGHLGGHPLSHTPAIDALAARGTTFMNAHCQAPLCNPSRASLMLSRRPSTTGIYGLKPWFREVPELAALESLPQYFRSHGYTTYMTGKIYHGSYGRQEPLEWDHAGPGASGGPFPPAPLVKAPSGHKLVDWGTFPHRDEDKGDWKVASWAVEQLGQMPKDKPFFLAAGFFLPHVPCYVTQSWYDLFPKDNSVLPLIQRDDRRDTPFFSWYLHWKLPEPRLQFLEEQNEWGNLVRSYLASTAFTDSQVQRVLEALEASGAAENTVVVLWSDHGWHLGEKEITGKNTLWDDGTRVPLVFAGPGVTPGQQCERPAELLDIYPTLVELAGLPAKDGLEGLSLAPQIKDARASRDRPAITTHNAGNHGIRSEQWRYIIYADGTEELYDHAIDPHEWTNLAKDPAFISVLEQHRAWIPADNARPVPGSAERILTYDNKVPNWEGEDIAADSAIPEITR
jgi:choline-sulfatase